jgi:hypothetical protein
MVINTIFYLILQEGVYYRLGQLSAMAFVHGGSSMNILCPSVYCGMKPSNIIVSSNEVAEVEIKQFLDKVL